jgi:hypothetical protein
MWMLKIAQYLRIHRRLMVYDTKLESKWGLLKPGVSLFPWIFVSDTRYLGDFVEVNVCALIGYYQHQIAEIRIRIWKRKHSLQKFIFLLREDYSLNSFVTCTLNNSTNTHLASILIFFQIFIVNETYTKPSLFSLYL